MKRGRKQTTGRFRIREELVDRVCFLAENGLSFRRVADHCEIREVTAGKIYDQNIGRYRAVNDEGGR